MFDEYMYSIVLRLWGAAVW